MAFLQETLDDDTAVACGRCDGCSGPWYPTSVPDAVVGAARERLTRAGVDLDPRVQWPTGMDRIGVPVKGKIGADESLQPGRALARMSDLGWGQRLREVLREDTPASPELLRACVPVLAEWPWARRPVGVVAVPSRSHPTLVASLAAGLAQIGRLPLLGSLDLAHGGPIGEAGGNSAFRLAGVWERFVVGPDLAGLWSVSTVRCCSSTTSCPPGGRSPLPVGRCVRPGSPRCCPSRSPSTADRSPRQLGVTGPAP